MAPTKRAMPSKSLNTRPFFDLPARAPAAVVAALEPFQASFLERGAVGCGSAMANLRSLGSLNDNWFGRGFLVGPFFGHDGRLAGRFGFLECVHGAEQQGFQIVLGRLLLDGPEDAGVLSGRQIEVVL